MIFNVPCHIEMIRNGLATGYHSHVPQETPTFPVKLIPEEVVKTQTRRLNRGIYQVGKDYAVQRKRGVKAESDIRIVMDRIWEEDVSKSKIFFFPITKENARAEGGYTPEEYEKVFSDINPNWDGWNRWAFEFHVIEVQK